MAVKVDKEYQVKKSKGTKGKSLKSILARKSAFAHKVNNGGKFYARNSKESQIKKGQSKEVMIKVTGSAKVKQGVKNSIDYISRDDSILLTDEMGNKINANDAKKNLINDEDATQLSEKSRRTPDISKNIVFSPPLPAGVKKEDALEAARIVLNEKFPDNRFVLAYHDDKEDHPHVHAILKTKKESEEKRIKITKSDLRDIRTSFAEELKIKGYDVKATHKQHVGLKEKLKNDEATAPKRQKGVYEVVDFGRANYQFDSKNKRQNFITVKTINKGVETTFWGKELGSLCEREKIQKGSLVKLRKVGTEDVKVPSLDKNGNQNGWNTTQRNKWELENLGLKGIDRNLSTTVLTNTIQNDLKVQQQQQQQFKNQAADMMKKEQQSLKVGVKII